MTAPTGRPRTGRPPRSRAMPGMNEPEAEATKVAGPPPPKAGSSGPGRPRKADEARATIDGLVRVIVLGLFPFSPTDAVIVAAYRTDLTDRLVELCDTYPSLLNALANSTKTVAPLGLIVGAVAPIALAIGAAHGWAGLTTDVLESFSVKPEAVEAARVAEAVRRATREATATPGAPMASGA